MAQDVRGILDSLDRWRSEVRQSMIPVLQRAEYAVEDGRRSLRGLDDTSAREAEDLAVQALDDLRNVIYGMLAEYERLDAELRRRIAES